MNITVHFHGGPLDGKTVSSCDGDAEEAERYFLLTHHGRRGQRFRVASDYAVERIAEEGVESDPERHFPRHSYEVKQNKGEDDGNGGDHVVLHVEYVRDT
jgi:hypothetical protein